MCVTKQGIDLKANRLLSDRRLSLHSPSNGTCPAMGEGMSCAVGADALCARYKLPTQPILAKCNLSNT